ncbi:hypothetical protein [Erwinia sp. V71]
MNLPSPADHYRKQQDEADRLKQLDKTKDFEFINQMLKAFGWGERK